MFVNSTSEWKDPKYADTYCIYWHQSLVLLLGYVLYAVTCANYQKIMAHFCPAHRSDDADLEAKKDQLADGEDRMSFEPAHNFRSDKTDQPSRLTQHGTGTLLVAALAPAHLRGKILSELQDTEGEAGNGTTFSCFLFKRSRFYTLYSSSSNAW